MTEQASYAQAYMLGMGELDRLVWRQLSLANTEDCASQQNQADHCKSDLNKRFL